jgi:predicted adenylyl cyclase CyaB
VRPDSPVQRESRYWISAVSQATELKAALSGALGVEVVVAKQRRLFLWQEVRIHLDAVEGLGSFIEFEAVAPPHSDLAQERQRVRELREAFGIDDADLVATSYCDLVLERRAQNGNFSR